MGKYFQEDIETASREEIEQWQNEGLVSVVKRVYENVPYYRDLMDKAGVTPDDIKSTADLPKLPFITKDDLRDAYPYGLLAVPLKDCIRIHSTSGTTGRRVVDFYTKKDIDMWYDGCARAIVAAGGTDEDVCHIAYGYGLFTGGFGLNGGSQKVGCLTLPMSSGNTDRQLQFMTDFGSTILCCTPSYASYLAESIEERGLKDQVKLKAGIFGAEAWSEEMRHDIESKLGIKAYDIYGLTEIEGPGVAFECEAQNGMHICEDYFIPEIVDPETLEPVPDGQIGELVFTTLRKHARPLIRFRTGDIGRIDTGKCKCGRTHGRIYINGRKDDMFIISAVNVFPSDIEAVVRDIQGITGEYRIRVFEENFACRYSVEIEKNEGSTENDIEVAERVSTALKSRIGVKPASVTVHEYGELDTRSEHKSSRVIDERKTNK